MLQHMHGTLAGARCCCHPINNLPDQCSEVRTYILAAACKLPGMMNDCQKWPSAAPCHRHCQQHNIQTIVLESTAEAAGCQVDDT